MSARGWIRTGVSITALAAVLAGLQVSAPAASTRSAAPKHGPGTNYATDDPFTADRTKTWRENRFGMFIHFGAYSNLEGAYTKPDGTVCQNAEWIQRECAIPKQEYEQIAAEFDPAGFDADAIAKAAAEAGQKYIVITAKHHEGYAMWPTEVNDWNLRDHSAFDPDRDIMAELKRATEKYGIELGFYYSIWDWHDPDFPDPATFPAYEKRMYAQLKELVDNYDPSILWFDGEWETDNPFNPWTAEDGEDLEEHVRDLSPDIVINNRVGKRRVVDGDTGTPEQEIPETPVDGQLWESCMTIGSTWGYADWDASWKSPTELTRNLVDIASRSGNYLLNVGPDSNGEVPTESLDRLHQMGSWLSSNGQGDAVYGAGAPGLVAEPEWGAVSRNGDQLYASVYEWPGAGESLTLDARTGFDVTGARVLGSDQTVDVDRTGDTVTLTPSGDPTNDIATVIELTVRTAEPSGSADGTGLSAKFWPNADFSGEPEVTRTDETVNYNWKFTGSPAVQIPEENFASRWTGEIEAPYSEEFTFATVSDDTVRLWVDGELVIDNTTPHSGTVDKGSVRLEAGKRYAIRLEQTEAGGEAVMKLMWSSPGISQRIVPTTRLYPTGIGR